MCVVSNVGDGFGRRWDEFYPYIPSPQTPQDVKIVIDGLTDAERKAFREFIQNDLPEFKPLLEAARRIDELSNQPDCENEEKFAKIRAYAEELGIDPESIELCQVSDVFRYFTP